MRSSSRFATAQSTSMLPPCCFYRQHSSPAGPFLACRHPWSQELTALLLVLTRRPCAMRHAMAAEIAGSLRHASHDPSSASCSCCCLHCLRSSQDSSAHSRQSHRTDEMHCLCAQGSGAPLQHFWLGWLLQDPQLHVGTSESVSARAEGTANLADRHTTQQTLGTISHESAQPGRQAWEAAALSMQC